MKAMARAALPRRLFPPIHEPEGLAAIIPPLMEAERLNLLADKLKDLKQRSAELRRYL